METWPWSFMAARVIAILTVTRSVVDLAFQINNARDGWQTLLPAAGGVLLGVILWFGAGAFADAVALAIETVRDKSRSEPDAVGTDGSGADDFGFNEPGPGGPASDEGDPSAQDPIAEAPTSGGLATIAFAAVGLYLVADGLPILLYTFYRLILAFRSDGGAFGGVDPVREGIAAVLSLAVKVGIGAWLIRNASRVMDMLPRRQIEREPGGI